MRRRRFLRLRMRGRRRMRLCGRRRLRLRLRGRRGIQLRALRQVELGRRRIAQRTLRVRGPDLGRRVTAVDALFARGAHEAHLRAALALAEDADRGDEARRVAGEPGRLVVVGGTRLARYLMVLVLHLGARTPFDHVGQNAGEGVGVLPREYLVADRVLDLGLAADVVRRGLDERRRDLLAVVVDRRVDPGHLHRARAHHAERHGGPHVEAARLGIHAQIDGGLLDLAEADVHRHLREDGVDGVVHRLLDGDVTVVHVVLVGRGERRRAALDGAPARAVVDGVGVDRQAVLRLRTVLERGGQDDRLEGGGRLVVLAGGVVDVVLEVVRTAVEREDLAGLRIHGGRADLRDPVHLALLGVELVEELALDGRLQRLLLLRIDVERDGPAAPGQLLLRHAGPQQLGVGRLHQVAGLAREPGFGLGLDRLGELHLVPLGLVEPALLDHLVQGVVPAAQRELLALRPGYRHVVLARRLEQRGQVGALLDRELVDVLAVVRAGGGLDAVGVAPVEAGVQIPGEDLVLVLLAVDLEGDDQFLHLAGDGLLLAQVIVLHVLLGDGRTTLLAAPHQGVEDAAGGALDVDAVVVVEVLVLDGDEGVLDVHRDLRERHGLTVGGALPGQHLAVAQLVDVALLLGGRVALRYVHVPVEPDGAADDERAHTHKVGEQLLPGEKAAYSALFTVRARLALCPADAFLLRLPRFRSAHRSRSSSLSAPKPSSRN